MCLFADTCRGSLEPKRVGCGVLNVCGHTSIANVLSGVSSGTKVHKLHNQGRLLHLSLPSFRSDPRHVTLRADEVMREVTMEAGLIADRVVYPRRAISRR